MLITIDCHHQYLLQIDLTCNTFWDINISEAHTVDTLLILPTCVHSLDREMSLYLYLEIDKGSEPQHILKEHQSPL